MLSRRPKSDSNTTLIKTQFIQQLALFFWITMKKWIRDNKVILLTYDSTNYLNMLFFLSVLESVNAHPN